MLGPEQIAFYEQNGYLVVDDVLDAQRLHGLRPRLTGVKDLIGPQITPTPDHRRRSSARFCV